MQFKYSGIDINIDSVLDRLLTAQVIDEINGIYTLCIDMFGKGIDMWLKRQGNDITVIE